MSKREEKRSNVSGLTPSEHFVDDAELLCDRAAAEANYVHADAVEWLAVYCRNNRVPANVRKLASELLDAAREDGYVGARSKYDEFGDYLPEF